MKGQIITFYSYKGGVGRSMAVANVAVLLAQRGHRVLAVDFDLDAPGLHRYFLREDAPFGADRRTPPGGQPGVIDMFVEMRTRVMEEALPLGMGAPPRDPRPAMPAIVDRLFDAGRYGYEVRVADPATRRDISLHLLTAGRFDDDYANRVHDFPWTPFYEEHGEVFDLLIAQWRKRYDYVLVDSRTGVSDVGSICTVVLPNKLVPTFSPNEQSLHGAIEVGRQAVALKRTMGADLPLFPLISRVDEGEESLRRLWARSAADRWSRLFEDLYGERGIGFSTYFNAVQVPYSGYYAYGEKIAVEEETVSTFGSLASAYARFLDCLRGVRLAGWEERIGDLRRGQPRDHALVASFEAEFDPPGRNAFDSIIRAPMQLAPDTSARLRKVPLDVEAWHQALAEIDQAVASAVASGGDDLHVFATMPYPAAVYLGRRLDDLGRARRLRIWQLDPETHAWAPFTTPTATQPPEAFFEDLEELPRLLGGPDVLLAIEGMRSMGEEALHALAGQIGAASIYRLRPRARRPLRSTAEVRGAVMAVREALVRTQSPHPSGPRPVHVVTTAPLALLIELGRLITPTVYASVIVHQFDPRTAGYIPVVDVITREIVSPA
jgi:hypothetical protein